MDKSLYMDKDSYYLAALCAAGGLGRPGILQAMEAVGSAEALFFADEAALVELGFQDKQISSFLTARRLDLPKRLERFCERQGVQLLTIFSYGYPETLKHIADPPLVLYVIGELPVYSYAVAMVGSRECTDYGLKAAAYFGKGLAARGIPIVSGGARGIDTAAHEACLAVGGKTIAVLGSGLDVAYPRANKELFRRIAEQGSVVTEYAPGTPPLAFNFPARNRIVVGLSQAVLVVEAKQKSGALITAHIAADEGRDVYAVPGNIFTGTSLGCHDLIRKGVKPVDRVEDILEDYQDWLAARKYRGVEQNLFAPDDGFEERIFAKQRKKTFNNTNKAKERQLEATRQARLLVQTPTAQKIYAIFKDEALGFDEIIELSGENFTTVSMAVLDLQVAELIQDEGMQRYRRI